MKYIIAIFLSFFLTTFAMVPVIAATVSQWNDISGNHENLYQPTSANRPTYTSSGLNGLGGITFVAANANWLYTSGDTNFQRLLFNSSGMTMFLVQSSANSNNTLDFFDGPTNQFFNFQNYGQFWDWNYGGASGSRIQVGYPGTGGHIFTMVAAPSSTRFINLDGTLQQTVSTGAYSYSFTCPFQIGGAPVIGSCGDASLYWDGQKNEIILYNTKLTTTQYQQVEGYLAWKWGLQGNLPAGHPYKSAAPTSFTPASLSNLSAWYDASNAASINPSAATSNNSFPGSW